ncbi:hypothetical protein L249_4645 [Ophiocordyceps polyrhachis-furcata BCC 54312]|uniref:Uncharacterized protein n=1 Tax=Ophiocordyceps polyrhachis-furcata BCC 54312 TaxID=1330021 RepID=A0A367L2K0_9HYPO|nr:hypothetical protein L249_4645 [Ophiocordyceps polyrhachis-furcata BCC 54312]
MSLPSALNLVTVGDDIHRLILDKLPTVSSLVNTLEASAAIRRSFEPYSRSIATRVIENELPPCIWRHAVVCQMLANGTIRTPTLDGTWEFGIESCIQKIRRVTDAASQQTVSLDDAVAMSEFGIKAMYLAVQFAGGCFRGKDHVHQPLEESLSSTPMSAQEAGRILQSVYLFDMLASLCKNMTMEKKRGESTTRFARRCTKRVRHIQRCIVREMMSPWEFYQVIGMQAFFRRVVHGLGCSPSYMERVMPGILVGGVRLMHDILEKQHEPEKMHAFVGRLQEEALGRPTNAFGLIVSRGESWTWTRTKGRSLNEYRQLGRWWDVEGWKTWKLLEDVQDRLSGSGDEVMQAVLSDNLADFENRTDLWSVALWDSTRWGDVVRHCLGDSPPRLSHWSAADVGIGLLYNPRLATMGREWMVRRERAL